MARPNKIGLSYFPFDVDFFDDDKIELINAEFGITGENIIIRLLCKIYKNGYYYQWGDDECLLFCKRAGASYRPSQIEEVISGCFRRSFFDERVFKMFGILTSNGIQKRYLAACAERKNVEIISDYWVGELPKDDRFLIIEHDKLVNPPDNPVNPPINPINPPENTQSKVKKSKGKINTMPEEKIPAYSPCMKIYNDFCLEKLGVKAKIDGTQGKALKNIIKYLKSNIKEKPASEQAICDAFEIIFQKYDRWGKFYQGQLKLNQIDSNLINIIKLIKNGRSTNSGCTDADVVKLAAEIFGTAGRN